MAVQKIALLGGEGMLASRLRHYLGARKDFQFFPLSHKDADVTDTNSLRNALGTIKPDWIINGSAFLNADRCEKELEASRAVNFQGGVNAAEAANEIGAKLIHFSTDYVFDGKAGGYTEADTPHPLCAYGSHKYMADQAITAMRMPTYILRAASVMGSGIGKPDLIQALLSRVAKGAQKLEVIDDMQISLSTPRFLSDVVAMLIEKQPENGLYNMVASGQTTWRDAAELAFEVLDVKVPINGISMDAFPRIAARPQKSWMKTDKLAKIFQVPTWQQALREQMAELKESYRELLKQASAA